jgi:citrate synthase
MSDFKPGLEGVVAFETEIAEPDKEGGALRYRGVDIEELVGKVPFEKVWGLLVDGSLEPGLPIENPPLEIKTGSTMADAQAGVAALGGKLKLKSLIDIDDDEARNDLARLSASTLSIVAQSARGDQPTVPDSEVSKGKTAAERFIIQWRGQLDPKQAIALDTYWICTAEHGLNASTFTARIAASTGADCAACLSAGIGTLSGPLHGGAPARVVPMLDSVAADGDADRWVKNALDTGERIMGFGHRVYRAEDPRARLLRRTAKELGAPRFDVAEALENAALKALAERSPGRVLATNVEFWSAVVLDVADIPPQLAPAMFACSRTAGWSAHVLEQKRLSRLVRPSAKYVGPGERSLASLQNGGSA